MEDMMNSKSFSDAAPVRAGSEYEGKGGVGGQLYDVRKDVDTALAHLEARTEAKDYPEIDWIDGAVLAAGGDIVIMGRELLQGQTFASLTKFTGTSELIFKALKPGEGGNSLTVALVHSLGLPVPTVAKVGNAITITADLGTHTADEIATEVNLAGADTDGYLTCNGGGAGVAQTAFAATALSGGVGAGWKCMVSGVECLPANTPGANGGLTVTETMCTVTVPDLTAETPARAAADIVAVVIRTDNILTPQLGAVLS